MTLGLYLSRILGLRILAAAFGLLALGLSLDLLRDADALIGAGGTTALARYALLRAPAMAAQVLPLAVLVGAVTGLLALARRSELIAMRAAGQSAFTLLWRLMPLALALGLAQHLLTDRGTAWSERALGRAFAGIAEVPAPEIGARVSGRIGGAVVIGRLARTDGTALAPVTVYALDAEGRIVERISAASARFDGARWRLEDAGRTGLERAAGPAPESGTGAAAAPPSWTGHPAPDGADPEDQATEATEVTDWARALTPATVRALASGRATATADEAAAALAGLAFASRSRAYYATRVARSRAAFAVPAVMLLAAAFASFRAARGPAGAGLAVAGVLLGLAFVTIDGVFGSLGSVGLLAPWIAAWGPTGIFAALGAYALLIKEE